MRKEFLLDLDSLTDLNEFIKQISAKIPCDVDAIYERQTVDAKSYLGLASISIHPVKVKINSDDEKLCEIFSDICEKYMIE